MNQPVDFEALFAHSPAAMSVHSPIYSGDTLQDFTVDAVNPAFERLIGLRSDELTGLTVRRLVPRVSRTWACHLVEAYPATQLSFQEYSEAEDRWLAMTLYRSGVRIVSAIADITDQVSVHQKTIEEATLYGKMFEIPDAIRLVIDSTTGKILRANAEAVRFYGWPLEELYALTIQHLNILSSSEIEKILELAHEEILDRFLFKHRVRSGEIRDVEVYTSPGTWQGRAVNFAIVRDVTEANRLQQAFLQRERLSAIGQLTASLYHEFGNLLGVLFSQFEQMEAQLPPGEVKEKLKNRLTTQFQRSRKLVDSVKRFAGHQNLDLEVCRMSSLVEDLVELETPQCHRSGVRIVFHPGEEDWVQIDQSLFQQVFLNLFSNAVRAVAKTPQPTIEIHVEGYVGEVEVRFANNGPVIDAETRARLFTPFYTTHNGEGGTGLGLSFSQSIVRQHQGDLVLADGPQTVFQIRLPKHAAP